MLQQTTPQKSAYAPVCRCCIGRGGSGRHRAWQPAQWIQFHRIHKDTLQQDAQDPEISNASPTTTDLSAKSLLERIAGGSGANGSVPEVAQLKDKKTHQMHVHHVRGTVATRVPVNFVKNLRQRRARKKHQTFFCERWERKS